MSMTICKECENAYNSEYKAKNAEKVNKKRREYYMANAEHIKEYKREWYHRNKKQRCK